MSEHDHKNKRDCCCDGTGAQGPQGVQGIQGGQGVQGVAGPQGIPGSCVNCPGDQPFNGVGEFAEVYSSLLQVLAPSTGSFLPGQAALLENTIFATSGIDVSMAASMGKITINVTGWYDVATGICGALNPIASPLPVWTLSLFKNGVYVPGSTFANMTLSPEQQSNEIVADVFVHFMAGDVLTLANTSTAQITLTAPTLGTNALPNSAYIKLSMLRAGM